MDEKSGLIFLGSSDFSAIVLQELLAADEKVLAICTQLDKKAGRGLCTRKSPVKLIGEQFGIPVFQPQTFRDQELLHQLRELCPDFFVVASYGLLLPEEALSIPAIAPLNIHPSLLPRYRGAAPIQRAIEENWQKDGRTGVSIMKVVKSLDAGPIYGSKVIPIKGRSFQELSNLLAHEGSKLLLELLPQIKKGLDPVPQKEEDATYASKLSKAEGKIDWESAAEKVDAFIRAMNPWPGASTKIAFGGEPLELLIRKAHIGIAVGDLPSGRVRIQNKELAIACQDNWLIIDRIQIPGRKEITAAEFLNGMRLNSSSFGSAS